MSKQTLGIAVVPCPWCGSTFPLVHDGNCFLVLAEERAMEIGRRSGYAAGWRDCAQAAAAVCRERAESRYDARQIPAGTWHELHTCAAAIEQLSPPPALPLDRGRGDE
jgi:hypothetical protein